MRPDIGERDPDPQAPCLDFAAEQAERITGRHLDVTPLAEIAAQVQYGGPLPPAIRGARKLRLGEPLQPGDIIITRTPQGGRHAATYEGGGIMVSRPRGQGVQRSVVSRYRRIIESVWRVECGPS